MSDRQAIEVMDALRSLMQAIRWLRARNGVPENKAVTMFIRWPRT